MSTTTPNFGLIKAELSDNVSQTIGTDQNNNMDTIDTNMQIYADHITSTTAHASQYITYTGSVSGTEVQGAINQLKSEIDAAIIGSGTSPAEVVAARDSIRSETNVTLDGRLDNIEKNQGQITSKSSSTTLVASERGIIEVDTSLGDVTLGLPTATGSLMMIYTIKKITADAYTVIIDPNAAETIDGNSTHTLTNQWDSIQIVNNGTNWIIISENDQDLDLAGLILTSTSSYIRTDTTDASDNKSIYINGGGGEGTTRGSQIRVRGNEFATNAGELTLRGGTVATGDIVFYTGSGSERLRIAYNGDLTFSDLTANRALYIDGSNNLVVSSVTDTELGYLSGVTSAIQTQLNNKQPLDADLTALAALSTTGIMARTAASTYTMRTITGTANQVSVSNGDGVSGNPTLSLPSDVYLGTGTIGADASTRIEFNATSDYITFTTNAGTQRLYIDSSGVLAIGGNDTETWISTTNAVEFYQSAIYSYNNDNVIGFACNAYYSATGWKRKATNAAGRYQMLDGIHYFYVATSDTEDTTISSWSNSLKVDATSIELPNLTANRALYLDASSNVLASSVTDTELGYLSGVTSAIQTQLNNKQPLDTDLTTIAALATSGFLTRSDSSTYYTRTITGTTNEIDVANGDGTSGNPTLSLPDIVYLGTSGKIGRNANNLIDFSNADQTMVFRTNGSDFFKIDGANGDLFLSGATNGFYRDTVDGTDDERMVISGGGSSTYARGGYLILTGNEYGTDNGDVTLLAGDAANAEINLYIAANKALTIENDLDAYFYGDVGIGRSATGSYALDIYKSTGTANQIIKSGDNTANLELDGYKTDNTTTSVINGLNNGDIITQIESLRDTADDQGKLILRTSDGAAIQPAIAIDSSQNTFIGDGGTTNYSKFINDGELNLYGTARVKKYLYYTGNDLRYGLSKGAEKQFGYYAAIELDIGEDSSVIFIVPQDWDSSTNITVYVDWNCLEDYATSNAEVQWQGNWASCPINGTENIAAPTSTGSLDSGDINIPTTSGYLLRSTVGTITGTNLNVGESLAIQMVRVALDGGTNPAGKVNIFGIVLEYTANKLGTAL